MVGRDAGPPRPEPGGLRTAGVVVLQLDPRYVREQFLPQLAEAHFGPLDESEFVVGVVRRADRSLVFSSDRSEGVGAPRRGDVERGLPGRWGRLDEDRVPLGEDKPGPGPGVGPAPGAAPAPAAS